MSYTQVAITTPVRTRANRVDDLMNMLSTKRPADSPQEAEWCSKWIKPLGAQQDKAGNWILDIPLPDGTASAVMWSSHTDTVHKTAGPQKVLLHDSMARLPKGSLSNCLGADCTTGAWIMREMVLARVPGLYIWHAAEEVGGLGSYYIASKAPATIDGIRYAIAFDRKGYSSVITHQGNRCCSNEFAACLAKQLPHGYAADNTGLFTDTANYTDLIGECTNISVGYFNQHTELEYQDVDHALDLLRFMLIFDESSLVSVRAPGEVDYEDHAGAFNDYSGSWLDEAFPANANRERSQSMAEFVRNNPECVADLLEGYGMTLPDLFDEYPGAN